MKVKKAWFEDWFDSKYYHILYGHRDQTEASDFILRLLKYLKPADDAKFLDLACGKGRHALEISRQGYSTEGLDLSQQSIQAAKQFETSTLHFKVGDMREVNYNFQFDYVFNLFTSFGYFEGLEENLRMLRSVNKQLVDGGLLLIDFLNFHKIEDLFPKRVSLVREGIEFKIEKKFDNGIILKDIRFEDGNQEYYFQEKVQAITHDQMLQMLEKTGFEVKTIWGNYGLLPYTIKESDRLILLAEKVQNV